MWPNRTVTVSVLVVALTLVPGAAARARDVAPAQRVGTVSASYPHSIPLPDRYAGAEDGVDGMVYVLSDRFGGGGERPFVTEVDPRRDTAIASLTLPGGLPAGNAGNGSPMVALAGSLWVVSYFHDEVLRIDPRSLRIVARIATGRAPAGLVVAGGSVWVVVQQNPSLARIDPGTDAVVQTVGLGNSRGTDGPWQAVRAGRQLLVSLPGSGRVAHVDIATGHVRGYDMVGENAASCAVILPTRGGYWLDDTDCSSAYYRWDAASRTISATIDPRRGDYGAVVVHGVLYTAQFDCDDRGCDHGQLVAYDATSGQPLRRRTTGSEPALPHLVAGQLWFGDFAESTVRHVSLF